MAPSHSALSLLAVAVPTATQSGGGYTRNDQYYAAGVGEYASNYGGGGNDGYMRNDIYYAAGEGEYASNYGGGGGDYGGGGGNRVYGSGGGYTIDNVYYAGADGMNRVYGSGGGYTLNDVYYSGDDLVAAGSNRLYGDGGGYTIDGFYYAGDDGGLEECLDVEWVDSSGNDCFFYEDNDLCGSLDNAAYTNLEDDADSACCMCGGGILGDGNGYVENGVYYAGGDYYASGDGTGVGGGYNSVDTGVINGAQVPSMAVPAVAVMFYTLSF